MRTHMCVQSHCPSSHMPLVTIRTAADLTGKHRTTLNRAISTGKLSATKSEVGHYLIDPAELERVYGALRNATSHPDNEPQDAQPDDDAHTREIALLREMLERERTSYDRERQQWNEERTFLRSLVDRHTDQIKLLTDQRERADAQRSWLARLLGRRSPAPPAP